jgi:hypothetical protein
MSHPGDDISVAEPTIVAVGCLSSVDVLPNIFAFLGVKDIMRNRRVNKKWKEAVKITIVPLCDFCVASVRRYNAMDAMTIAMPNLQSINLRGLGYGHKYNDGEDPNEELAAETVNWMTHDIERLSNFSKLRGLDISTSQSLNGRYPVFFNSFPLLQKLRIEQCNFLEWDLEMLAGFPVLKELYCRSNPLLTGNIGSLRVLKDTLQNVTITDCSSSVEGNFMDLADFPHLKKLELNHTVVTGDIRDVGKNDFVSLERLILPGTVYGCSGCDFQRISDAPDLVRAVYLFNKQRPALEYLWQGRLSKDSPDWYRSLNKKYPPPFRIHFVKVGSRLGYRWQTDNCKHCCEVNWLDPEPDRASSDYNQYIEELQEINSQVKRFYRGLHQPPTEEEYHRRWEEYKKRRDKRRDNEVLYRSSSGEELRRADLFSGLGDYLSRLRPRDGSGISEEGRQAAEDFLRRFGGN